MPVPSLPHELWTHIIHFIIDSGEQLHGLISVNRAFYEAAMEQRYTQISLAYLTSDMVRLVERLRDPEVAKWVRRLYIYPHFMKDLLHGTKIFGSLPFLPAFNPSPGISTSYHNCNSTKCIGHGGGKSPHPHPHSHTHTHVPAKLKKSPPKSSTQLQPAGVANGCPNKQAAAFIQTLTTILSTGLPNLVEYNITWQGIEGLDTHAPAKLLVSAFASSSTIKSVSLDVSLEMLDALYRVDNGESFKHLRGLEELDLLLRVDSVEHTSAILSQTLAPLFTSLTSLTKLTLRLFHPLDLSPFFLALTHPRPHPYPRLKSLTLDMPTRAPYMGPAHALTHFLNLHAKSLRELCLHACELDGGLFYLPRSPVGENDSGCETLTNWIDSVFLSPSQSGFPSQSSPSQPAENGLTRKPTVILPKLHHLEMALTKLPFEAAMSCIRALGGGVEELVITGAYLDCGRVGEVVGGCRDAKRKREGKVPELVEGSTKMRSESRVEGQIEKVPTRSTSLPHHSGSGSNSNSISRPRPALDANPIVTTPRIRRLKRLRIGTITLSPQLLDLIVECLPDLVVLEMLVRDTVPSEGEVAVRVKSAASSSAKTVGSGVGGVGSGVGGAGVLVQDRSQIKRFFTAMKSPSHIYPHSSLRVIELVQASPPYRVQYPERYEKVFRRSMPRVERVLCR